VFLNLNTSVSRHASRCTTQCGQNADLILSFFLFILDLYVPTYCKRKVFLHLILHSLGLLRTREQPVTVTSNWQQKALARDTNAPGGIRNRNSNKRAAADPRFRPRSHWDRL